MATKQECEAALRRLVRRLDAVEESLRRRHAPERTVSCRVPDLQLCFSGRLHNGALTGLTDIADEARGGRAPGADAQIRLTMSSDDLVAVSDGALPVSEAWADGRVKVEASVFDLLKMSGLALTRQLDG